VVVGLVERPGVVTVPDGTLRLEHAAARARRAQASDTSFDDFTGETVFPDGRRSLQTAPVASHRARNWDFRHDRRSASPFDSLANLPGLGGSVSEIGRVPAAEDDRAKGDVIEPRARNDRVLQVTM